MIVQDKIIQATILEEILDGIEDRIIEEITRMKDTLTRMEIGIDQEKELSQGTTITAEIEVQAIVDGGQGLEQIQIGIE